MLRRIFRKIINNLSLNWCLLIGLILAVAIISSIPTYSQSILQRMLTRDLVNFQNSTGIYPGTYKINLDIVSIKGEEATNAFKQTNIEIGDYFFPQLDLPKLASNCSLADKLTQVLRENEEYNVQIVKSIKVQGISDIEEHINLKQGKLPAKDIGNGTYEALVTEKCLKDKNLILGNTYDAYNSYTRDREKPIKIKVVGVFSSENKADPFWYDNININSDSFFINFDSFINNFVKEETGVITSMSWYYAFDYNKLTIDKLPDLLKKLEDQGAYYSIKDTSKIVPAYKILLDYSNRAKFLRTTLWILQVPILVMVLFYLFMVAQLIVDAEKNEIALLKSRGASAIQIMGNYILQALILSALAVAFGPLIGLFLCKVLGASNGFLQFVQRTGLPVKLNSDAYIYSIIGVLVFMVTMLIPVYFATKTTIVVFKQKKNRKINTSFWQRYYLDIVMLAVTFYGLYSYRNRQNVLMITGGNSGDIPIDPILFLISTFFIMALGMLFLRLFPYIINFVFWLGRRIWGPVAYGSLTTVARSGNANQFIMLFLILTISLGIFNANAARTINTNVEEKVKYFQGADIVIKARWGSNAPKVGNLVNSLGQPIQSSASNKTITYSEPPFSAFASLKGVDTATKVLRKSEVTIQVNETEKNTGYLLAIDYYEFSKISLFTSKLLDYPLNSYLNLLSENPSAFIVSSSFREKYRSKIGDTISIKWGDNKYLQGIIYAFVDYWPTYNPYEQVKIDNKSKKTDTQDLIVANLSYIQAKTRMEPYEIWIKTKEGTPSEEIYKDIEDKELQVEDIKDTNQSIISKKNDPILQGTNGALTMDFMATMIIAGIGFLIYWILSIKKRTLDFGIFRSMGLRLGEVIAMLLCEQVLISGSSIIIGIIIGGITSDLFIPLLQMVSASSEQIPPFIVVALRGDYIKLYIILSVMMISGFIVLGRFVAKIKLNEAIKLGES